LAKICGEKGGNFVGAVEYTYKEGAVTSTGRTLKMSRRP